MGETTKTATKPAPKKAAKAPKQAAPKTPTKAKAAAPKRPAKQAAAPDAVEPAPWAEGEQAAAGAAPAEKPRKVVIRKATAAAAEAAARGELPVPPEFSAATHTRWRPLLAQAVKLAEAGDAAGLRALEVPTYSTSPKAIGKFRDLCVLAIEAREAAKG